MTETQVKANEAFYKWEADNNEQDLSDRDRMIWTAGWTQANEWAWHEAKAKEHDAC